jgi:hypothetical protein
MPVIVTRDTLPFILTSVAKPRASWRAAAIDAINTRALIQVAGDYDASTLASLCITISEVKTPCLPCT